MDEKTKEAFLKAYNSAEEALNLRVVKNDKLETTYFTGAKEVLDYLLYLLNTTRESLEEK